MLLAFCQYCKKCYARGKTTNVLLRTIIGKVVVGPAPTLRVKYVSYNRVRKRGRESPFIHAVLQFPAMRGGFPFSLK